MYPFKYRISLRFYHPDIEPDYICNKLELKADIKWKAGTQRMTPQGQLLPSIYETSYCCFKLTHEPKMMLADFIKKNNSLLYTHKPFFESLRSTGGRIEYFVGWFSQEDSGEVFDHELLKELGELGIDIALSVYRDIKATDNNI